MCSSSTISSEGAASYIGFASGGWSVPDGDDGPRAARSTFRPAEAVQRALAVHVSEQGAELVGQPDVGELVQRAHHDRGQIAVDLGVDDVQRQDPAAPWVLAPVQQPDRRGLGRVDLHRALAAVRALVDEAHFPPPCRIARHPLQHAVPAQGVRGVGSAREEADCECVARVAADCAQFGSRTLADLLGGRDQVELPLGLLER